MSETSKYNVGKDKADRTFNGIVFDSAMEMKYYRDVILPALEHGTIRYFERQKKYILQPSFIRGGKKILPIEYKADYYVQYTDGREEVIDIKGCPDNVALLKRKLFWYVYPGVDYKWIGYSRVDGGWTSYEAIKQGRAERRRMKKQKENKDGKKEKGDC